MEAVRGWLWIFSGIAHYEPLKLQLQVFLACHTQVCCYGNVLRHENSNNMFTNDWAVF